MTPKATARNVLLQFNCGGLFLAHSLNVKLVAGRYAVSQVATDTDIPQWFCGPGFKAAIYSDDETTLVCLEDRVPAEIPTEKGWACLRTVGPFPFDAAGIVQSLIAPLSSNNIGVFVVCTYDGEHVLIPATDTDKAIRCLRDAGHTINKKNPTK
ncbi:ACT domain-containing protein [Pseudosulfitobacter sp. DSM 107133]|uniref:ACT domain-containing protein n=1 Tax=Pseudosulfitobacter sp. DSM 107133 TaxID=2883100 RepID=UPI000DF237AF|nr:ACT domain-containing protein [Pseudosulfitobacter sp. DSM 107133]